MPCRRRCDPHVSVLRDPCDRLWYVGESDVQPHHLPADEPVLDAYVVSHSREIAHRKKTSFLSLRCCAEPKGGHSTVPDSIIQVRQACSVSPASGPGLRDRS